jgi:hypothetical protein
MNKRILAALLALPLSTSAYAQEPDAGPTVKVSGFGTGALTMSNTDDAEFARANQTRGVKKDARTGVDSNLGLQADVVINSWLSVTGQGLVRKDAQDDYGAEATLAFAKARINDELSIRAGRMGVPVFMISEYRNVGYANNFVRPPQEMYSQVPFGNIDGIDAIWQHAFGDVSLMSQLAVGRTKADIAGNLEAEMKSLVALNLVGEYGPFTARFGRAQGKLTITGSVPVDGFLASLRTAGAGYRMPVLNALAGELAADSKKSSFTSVGLGLDWNNVIGQAEYAKRKSDSYLNDTTSWYVMGGYRIGKFLPYYVHANLSIDSSVANTVPAACPAGFPAACRPTLAALSGGVVQLRSAGTGQGEQSTNTIGVRWDLYSKAALKFQVDRIKPKNGKGLFVNVNPGFSHAVTVGTVAIDFVF